MAAISFLKMHGLGNDFVVLDARHESLTLTGKQIQQIADRRLGVGCDQLIVLEDAPLPEADVFMRIYNADGSEVAACGNATRCVAWKVAEELNRRDVVIQTLAGVLRAEVESESRIAVDMGMALLQWQDIPLAKACDTLHMPVKEGVLKDPVGVSMGNPHAVFFVEDAEAVPLELLGPKLEHHALFPKRANISVAQVRSSRDILLRVWERGAGLTQACGTAACAVLVAARRRGLCGPEAKVHLPGGVLEIRWLGDEETLAEVWMTGPAAVSFTGVFDLNSL